MDASRFDRLARVLGSSSSRRAALHGLLGASLLSLLAPDVAGKSRRRKPSARRNRNAAAQRARGGSGGSGHDCPISAFRPGADLRGCDFSVHDLSGRDCSACILSDVSFQKSNLRGVILDAAVLSGASFRDAGLVEASLRGSTLLDADLCGANLIGANLQGAAVSQAQLDCAALCNTRLPDDTVSDRDLGTEIACGSCKDRCAKDETCCDGVCANLLTDTKHCVVCGNACPPSPQNATVSCGQAVDTNGQLVRGCVYTCDQGWDDCDNDFETGCEVNTERDAQNCGGCAVQCEAGRECCVCACVEPGTTDCGLCPTIRNAKLIRRP